MTGRYKAYPETKNSNTEWLDEVPTHWVVSKFAYVKTVLTDYTANGSFADLKKNVTYKDKPSFARLVRLTDLRRDLDNEGVWIDEGAYNYLKKSALFGGEFLLANVGAYAGLFYQMPYNKGAASLAPNMFMAKFSETKILPLFMAYVGQCDPINKQLTLNATASSAQPKLNKDDFKSIKFCYPALIEQQKIANFLEHETAKIDTLITKQEKLIELLKEKRQAVISHAVTKGLNPDAPMKDSGVEWLGEVPEHWEVGRVKNLAKLISKGTTPSTIGGGFIDEGIRFLKGENIGKSLFVNLSPTFYISEEVDAQLSRSRLQENDVLVIIAGATTGKASILTKELLPANTNQAVSFIRPNKTIYSKLIALWLSTEYAQRIIWMGAVQAAQPNLSMEDLGNLPIVLPDEDEVIPLLNEIDRKIEQFDALTLKANSAIELIKERKTALISAAVTGKIDVRDWQGEA